MTAAVIPFARAAEEAWDAYVALIDEARSDPRLFDDADHEARRKAAHEVFTALFLRECARGEHAKVRRA